MYFKKLVRDGSEIQEDGEITPSSDSVTVIVSQLVQSSDPASRKVDRLVTVSSADLEVGGLDVDSSQTQCRPSSSKLSTLVQGSGITGRSGQEGSRNPGTPMCVLWGLHPLGIRLLCLP
jgi:hypothetical protein